ncbi:TNF receptor-associated factor [Trema orientale]|uniref:TNF receptor-associated factor n=1 Tax=Trema orientale TaxID=63057 RepID=A0A2P5D9B5_TREOI|nr:TNF receptor-associated factor [Trema orientale]
MTPVCPFVKASRPDDGSPKKCPFGFDSPSAATNSNTATNNNNNNKQQQEEQQQSPSPVVEAKCPFGYDSQTFKLGPLSCIICQALIFQCARCVPCSHAFCKGCISRFKDCPLCGADIEKIEEDEKIQSLVDRFIEGHARIKRTQEVDNNSEDNKEEAVAVSPKTKTVIYEDVSLERGAFLFQHAMRAFRAQNIESAKSRLSLCAEDIRDQLEKTGNSSELCSQLGAVLGMLGDCCRATGDAASAVSYFEESVEFLSKLPRNDLEITHTLSVSLNKIGDLKYYDGDLQAARSYYFRSLNVRRDAVKDNPNVSSLILDLAVSLAKVADVDRSLGNEDVAVNGFQEAIKLVEPLKLKSEEIGLEPRLVSVLEFLKSQLVEKQAEATL